MQKNVKKLCLSAVLAALYVGLDYLAVSVSAPFGGTVKLSLSGIAVLVIAAFCGPVWGAATGFVGAFIGQMITYGFTATTLLWVMPAVLRGIVFGLLFIAIKRRVDFLWLLIPTLISGAVVTAANTIVMYIDAKIYHYPVTLFGAALVSRIIAAVITSIIFALILPELLKYIKKIVKE